MTPNILENISTWLVDWSLVTIMGNTTPPRDPNDENDEDDEDDEDDEGDKDDEDDEDGQDEPVADRDQDAPMRLFCNRVSCGRDITCVFQTFEILTPAPCAHRTGRSRIVSLYG
jgi:hypothetical protein